MACRITNIKDENLKLLVAQYGQADGLKRFLKGELNTEASILKVSDNLDTYKEYNLLNKNNELKNVNPEDQRIKDWVKTLNNSPYYLFKLKRTTDGKAKIFMYDKLATMGYSLDSEGLSPSKPTVVIARLENIKTNLYNLKNKTKERSKVLDINRRIKFLEERKIELDKALAENDDAVFNLDSWYNAYKTMIHNVNWIPCLD